MSMLPRLKPRCFYDLVIEVAIVRPGPIQGGMVHPYLRRRQGLEPVTYPRDGRRRARAHAGRADLPGAGDAARDRGGRLHAGEADRLRRAMAAWRRKGGLEAFEASSSTAWARGYTRDFARQIFQQIEGFGEYGFPESHAASFALLVYVSAGSSHEPAAFPARCSTASRWASTPRRSWCRTRAPRRRGAPGGCAAQRLGLHAGIRRDARCVKPTPVLLPAARRRGDRRRLRQPGPHPRPPSAGAAARTGSRRSATCRHC
jgi:hypothetical protein